MTKTIMHSRSGANTIPNTNVNGIRKLAKHKKKYI